MTKGTASSNGAIWAELSGSGSAREAGFGGGAGWRTGSAGASGLDDVHGAIRLLH